MTPDMKPDRLPFSARLRPVAAGLALSALGMVSPPATAVTPASEAGADAAVLSADTLAPDPASHPYEAIFARNAFGLKEPPPPPPPAPPPDPTPPVNTNALKLTGITTLLGKRAMFVFNDGRTNIVSDLVREGERDRFITNLEVLEIDAKAGAVKVLFGGRELRLDFVNHGLRPPTNIVATPPAMAAARPGLPTFTVRPAPGAIRGAAPNPGVTVGNPAFPARLPGVTAGNTTFTAPDAGPARTVPLRPSRLGSTAASNPPAPDPQSVPTPEQQVLILQEQHRVARELNIELPPPPPAPGLEHLSSPALPGPPVLPGMGGPPRLPGQ